MKGRQIFLLLCVLMGVVAVVGTGRISAETTTKTHIKFNPETHEANWIELKFVDGLTLRLRDGVLTDESGTAQLQDAAVATVLAKYDSAEWHRSHTVDEASLDRMRRDGIARTGNPLPDLNLFFRLRLPDSMTVEAALSDFATLDIVEVTMPVSLPVPPPLPPDYEQPNDGNLNANNVNIYQAYLEAATNGIDADLAWLGGNGRGGGVKICDVEYGWFGHADLPTITRVGDPPYMGNDDSFYDHGTAVLGVLGSLNNGWGTTGIAYDADLYFAASQTAGSFLASRQPMRLTWRQRSPNAPTAWEQAMSSSSSNRQTVPGGHVTTVLQTVCRSSGSCPTTRLSNWL